MKDINLIKKEILEKYNGEFEILDDRIVITEKKKRREFLVKINSTNTQRWLQLTHLNRYKYNSIRYNKEVIISRINEITNGEYEFISGDNFNYSSHINILHKKCGNTASYRVSHFFNDGTRCKKCLHNSLRKDIETVKNEIYTMSNGKIFLKGNYEKDSEKMLLECAECKLQFKKSMATLRRQFKDYDIALCPHCYGKKYIGEVFIKEFLLNNNFKFEEQKILDGCKYKSSLKFDFIVYNSIDITKFVMIEYDGRQHNDINSIYAGKDFTEIKIRDSIKDEFCKNHNIPLLRITTSKKHKIEEEVLKFLKEYNIKSSTTIPYGGEIPQ